MINREKLENFVIGNHNFSKDDYHLKYRFLLINSLLLVGVVLTSMVAIVRILMESYTIAIVDASFSLILFSLFFYLRRSSSNFNMVSTLTLGIIFVFFTAIIILLKDEQSKLIWFVTLISAAYLVKGQKVGIKVFILTSVTLIIMHFLPFLDLNLENRDIIMTVTAYSCIAFFMTLSEEQQSKNIQSIKESADEITQQQKVIYEHTRVEHFTKLPNKIVLQEEIESSSSSISCLILNINNFEIISNEFGEDYINQLIIQVSEILKNLETSKVTLYYFERASFSFLIENPTYEQDVNLAKTVKSVFENLQVECNDIEIFLSFKIAIVREKSDKTLIYANMTLEEMKKSANVDYKIYKYDKNKEDAQNNNMYWAKRLGELMSDDKIIVYYQPIIDNSCEKIEKYECLVRAIDGDKVISPYFFLPSAKSKGVLKNITKIVIDKSFKIFSENDYDFSINITEQDLNDNYLVDFLSYKVKQYDINPNRVFLEVLENINSQDSQDADDQFKKLKELGFKLAIDDFGAESSNFSRLLTLKADIIKIDGQFIKNLDTNSDSVKIVETVVSLAKKMDVKTVAEFVHNEEIYDIVKELGVDFSQGYYFSPPLPKVVLQEENVLEEVSK